MNDPRKKKYFPNEYKQILKQTYSNHNLSGKKGPVYIYIYIYIYNILDGSCI